MLPIFIIFILCILPSSPATITHSKPNSIIKSTHYTNSNNPIHNLATTYEDVHLSDDPQWTLLAEEDRRHFAESMEDSSIFEYRWWSPLQQNAILNLAAESIFIAYFNGIMTILGTDTKQRYQSEVFLKQGENTLTIRAIDSKQSPAGPIVRITSNKIQIKINKINKQPSENYLSNQKDDNKSIKQDHLEFINGRFLQGGQPGGNSEGGSLDYTDGESNYNGGEITPTQQNNTTPYPTEPAESPVAPQTPNEPAEPPVAPQTPKEPSSTPQSNNIEPQSSMTTLVLAISVPIATITIIAVTCMVLKNAPQPEQTDCAVTTTQSNVGTAADTIQTDPNQGMYPVQENVDRHPQLAGF